jgi:hypothetical protein
MTSEDCNKSEISCLGLCENNAQSYDERMKKYLWITVLGAYSFVAIAGPFRIDITDYDGLSATVIDALEAEIETEVNNELPNSDQGEFFGSMANASQMAGKDLAYDPVNPIKTMSVSLAAGAAIDLNKKNFNDIKDANGDIDYNQAPGVGVQGALSLGLRPFFLPESKFVKERWDMFLHFFRYTYEKTDYDAKTGSMGFHGRYRLHAGKELARWGLLEWSPVYVGFGLQYNNLSGTYRKTFSESKESGGITGTFNAVGTIKVDVTTYSFPLEISTGVRFLHFFHLYGGLGVDITTGEASGNASLSNSSVTLTNGGSTATGTASLDLGTSGKPELFTSRAMAGFQLHLWKLKIFVQGQKTFGRNLYSGQVGLRAVF